MHKHSILLGALTTAFWMFQITLSAAQPTTSHLVRSSVLGRWEVVDMLTPKAIPRNQINASADDLTSLGRIYDLREDFAMYKERKIYCSFDADSIQKNVPIAALFADEPASKQAPRWVNKKFDGRMSNYDLRSFSRAKVTVYHYRCTRDKFSGYTGKAFEENTSEDDYRLNDVGNWFAASDDMLVMPFTADGIRILKRQPKKRVAEHQSFCAKAVTSNERAICGEREIWLMHATSQSISACVFEHYPERRAAVTELERDLAKCDGERDCVYGFTESITDQLRFALPITYSCANTAARKMKIRWR
jgi:hypothetical protein